MNQTMRHRNKFMQPTFVNEQFKSNSPHKNKIDKTLGKHIMLVNDTKHFLVNGRDTNSQLVLHGRRGSRIDRDAPTEYIKACKNKDAAFNNCIETKVLRQLSNKPCHRNYDVYNLNSLFGLKSEISNF